MASLSRRQRRRVSSESVRDSLTPSLPLPSSSRESTVLALIEFNCKFFESSTSADEWTRQVRLLATQSFRYADMALQVSDAVEWGRGFEFNSAVFTRDALRLAANDGDLAATIDSVQEINRNRRFSRERVLKHLPQSYEPRSKLLALADGMPIFPADGVSKFDNLPPLDFKLVSRPPPFRGIYTTVADAVHKLLEVYWDLDLALIVPSAIVCGRPGIHYSPLHWTKKHGKPQGRNLVDSSDNSHGSSLNRPESKAYGREHIGAIKHPTLTDYARMILSFYHAACDKDSSFTWNRLRLFKEDINRAYTHLSFLPSDAGYMAAALVNGLTIIFHCGTFGWDQTPFYFDLISKALEFLIAKRIHGSALIYTDDIGAVTSDTSLVHDQGSAVDCLTDLLGPDAHAADKAESGRCLVLIGYEIDLDLHRVSLAEKNFLSTFHFYLTLNIEAPILLIDLQRAASYASRYQEIIPSMAPFTNAFFGAMSAYGESTMVKLLLPPKAKRSVWLWRAILVLARYNRLTFTRSIESFAKTSCTFLLEFDASLWGVGAIISSWCPDRAVPTTLWGIIKAPFPYDLGHDSSFQNCAEFSAVVYGIVALIRCGARNCSVRTVGDSTNALSWSTRKRFKSSRNERASIVFTLLCLRFGISIDESEWLSGEENTTCDGLSRDKPIDSLPWPANVHAHYFHAESCWGRALPLLLDPTLASLDELSDFSTFWNQTLSTISELENHPLLSPFETVKARST